MSTSTSGIFTGSSQFSSSFQSVIANAVQLASLPMQQTQNDVTRLNAQSSELSSLNSDFAALQTAIGSLNSALGLGSYSASATSSVSGTTVASVALSGTPGVGTYSIEVDGVGSYATAMSTNGSKVADPSASSISSATNYTLTVGSKSTTIEPAGASLSSLANAINASSAGVTATVVNVGSNTAPDYRLSIQNGQLADTTIQLTANDGSPGGLDLLTGQADGAAATYRVNGVPAAPSTLSSSSPTITLAPGVSVNLLAAGTSAITVTRNANAVSSALSGFVSAYNAAQAEINTNRGQGTGALQGQSILMSLSETLSQLADYSNGYNGISSLTSLGLSFDSSGVLSYDSSAFATATTGQLQQLSNFLGSTTTGGFLKSASDALTSITDATNGLIPAQIASVKDQITHDNTTISAQQDKVDTLQTNLTQQMATADASISTLEQQYSYLAQMFQQMQINSQNGG